MFLTVFMILSVSFVNGLTDAPNSVASCVATKTLTIKKALRIAAVSDFAGSMTAYLFGGKVADRIVELSSTQNNELYIVSVFSAMLSVVIWAVTAWYFGIPTSESHSLLAGLFGSSVAVNNGFENTNINEWIITLSSMIISVISGVILSYILSLIADKIINKNNYTKLEKCRVVFCIISSFLHGAQDSQKFSGIIITLLSLNSFFIERKQTELIVTVLCAFMISVGTLLSGNRIIGEIGNNLVKLNKLQGFSADLSGFICLGLSTALGVPVSTTHIKTASIIGAGSINGYINQKSVTKLIIAWIMTFPICMLLSYTFIRIIL